MAEWINVMPVAELKPGMHTEFRLKKLRLLLANIKGEFYAVEDRCSHDNGRLSGGEICAGEITCPRHGARFDLKTGAVLSPPAFEDIATFPVRVVDDMVQVFDEQADS